VCNLQLATHNTHFLQAAENLFRHALGKIDEAVILANIDVPNVPPFQASLIRNRAHNIPGLHAVGMPDFNAISLEFDAGRRAFWLPRGSPLALTSAIRRAIGSPVSAVCMNRLARTTLSASVRASVAAVRMALALSVASNMVRLSWTPVAMICDEARVGCAGVTTVRTGARLACAPITPVATLRTRTRVARAPVVALCTGGRLTRTTVRTPCAAIPTIRTSVFPRLRLESVTPRFPPRMSARISTRVATPVTPRATFSPVTTFESL
jgi:hypothetical protein